MQPKEKNVSSHMLLGRVMSVRCQDIEVLHQKTRYICTLRGMIKKGKDLRKNLVIVGDFVHFEPSKDNCGVICEILPRQSVLCRQDHLRRLRKQLVAANVDQVIITVSLNAPLFKPSMIDRYLVAAEKGGMNPIVVINKMDLRHLYPDEHVVCQECVSLYRKIQIPAFAVSALTGEGLDDLKAAMKDKTSVFSGQSGTGKTLLVNSLTGLSLKTADVRAAGKGAHTTTFAQLLELPFGGWCVDTPGIRSFGIWELDREDIIAGFPEIFAAARNCGFADCSHTGEDKCALPDAIEQGVVSPTRFNSYLSLLSSLQESAANEGCSW